MERHVAGGTTRGGRAPMGGVRKLGYGREISEKTPGVILVIHYDLARACLAQTNLSFQSVANFHILISFRGPLISEKIS